MESEGENGNEEIEAELPEEITENEEEGNLDAENDAEVSERAMNGEREQEKTNKNIEDLEESDDFDTPEETMELTMPVPAKYLQNCTKCERRFMRRGKTSGSH